MSNLSEIRSIPGISTNDLVRRDSYGNIQKTRTFTANGDIDEGSFVALRSEGEVEKIQQFVVSETQAIDPVLLIDTQITNTSSTTPRNISTICYHPIEDTMVVFYADGNDNRKGKVFTCKIMPDGSLDEDNISNPIVFSEHNNTFNIVTSYNSTSNTIICTYNTFADTHSYVRIITIDNLSINLGSMLVLHSTNDVYHASHSNKPEVMIIFGDRTDSFFLYGAVGRISGTEILLGSHVRLNSYGTFISSVEYDPSSYSYAVSFLQSGIMSIIYCSTIESNEIEIISSEYQLSVNNVSSTNKQFFIKYYPPSKSIFVTFRESLSAIKTVVTSVKFFPNNQLDGSDTIQITHFNLDDNPTVVDYVFNMDYHPPSKSMIISWLINNIAYFSPLSIVDNSIVSAGNFKISTPELTNEYGDNINLCYHPISRKTISLFRERLSDGAKGYFTNIDIAGTSTNANKWIGVAEHSVDSAAEEVNVRTFSGTAQTNQTGLIPGERYYLNDIGLLTRHPLDGRFVGVAETSSSIRMVTNPVEQDNIPRYYTFPSSDGDASQILETDGNGNVSWKNNALPDYVGYFDGTNSSMVTSVEWHGNGNITISREASHQYRLTFPDSYETENSYTVQLSTTTSSGNSGFGTYSQVFTRTNESFDIWFVQGNTLNASGDANNIRCFVIVYPIDR